MTNEVYVATKAVIVKDSKILIIKRSGEEDVYADEWDLPGGKLNFGEEPIKGLEREVFEETGIKIEVIKPIDVWTFFKNNGNTQVIGITFLTKPKTDKITLSEEHTGYKWVSLDEIKNYKIHEGIKKTIKELKDEITKQND